MARTGRPKKAKGARLVRTGIALPPEMHHTLQAMGGPDSTVSQTVRRLLRAAIADYATKPEAVA